MLTPYDATLVAANKSEGIWEQSKAGDRWVCIRAEKGSLSSETKLNQ